MNDPKVLKHINRLQEFCEKANIGVEKSIKCLFRVILHKNHKFYPTLLGSGYHANAIIKVFEWEKQRFGTNRGAHMALLEDDTTKIFNKLKSSHATYLEQKEIFQILLKDTEVEQQFWKLLFENKRMSPYYIVLSPELYEIYKEDENIEMIKEIEDLIEFIHHHPDFSKTLEELYKEVVGKGMSALVDELSKRTLCKITVNSYLGGLYK